MIYFENIDDARITKHALTAKLFDFKGLIDNYKQIMLQAA
jgi:hypothetical protein